MTGQDKMDSIDVCSLFEASADKLPAAAPDQTSFTLTARYDTGYQWMVGRGGRYTGPSGDEWQFTITGVTVEEGEDGDVLRLACVVNGGTDADV